MHYARKHQGDIDDFFMVACSLKYMITNRYEDRKITLNKSKKKERAVDTRTSQAVPHLSTNHA